MRLYHCLKTVSFRVLWTLEELRLNYDLVNVELSAVQDFPDFHLVNPRGTGPALIDGESVLIESRAICLYLCTGYGEDRLAVGPSDANYCHFLNFLFGCDTWFAEPALKIHHLENGQATAAQELAEMGRKTLSNHISRLEGHLAEKTFIAGDKLTIADITVHFGMELAGSLGMVDSGKANCLRWMTRLQELESYQMARALESARSKCLFP